MFLAAVCLIMSCSKSDSYIEEDENDISLKCGKPSPSRVTLPFRLDLTGVYTTQEPDAACGYDEVTNPWMWRIIVDADGTGSLMGKVSGNFSFCCDVMTGIYGPAELVLVAPDGDELYLSCQGQVLGGRLEDHPEYVTSYWRDPFTINGGTGRFEGATGGGWTDDYNSSLDPNSHHHWRGTITLQKGRHPFNHGYHSYPHR